VSWWDRLVANRSVPTPRALVIQMYHELSASLLPSFYMAGTAVFATSGALAAARARQTPLTFAFFAVVTGIGGKTLSELLMGRQSRGFIIQQISSFALLSRYWPGAHHSPGGPIAQSTGSMRLESRLMAR
jgi:hypothetical protein